MYRRKRYGRSTFKRRVFRRKRRVARKHKNNGTRFFKQRFQIDVTGGVQTVVDMPSTPSTTTWSSLSSLFGYYRVCAMKIKYVPHYNTFQSASGAIQSTPVYIVHDWDNLPTAPTRDQLQMTETVKCYDPTKPFTYFRKMVRRMPISGSPMANGYQSTGAPGVTQRFVYSFGTASNSGIFHITRYIAVRQRI